MNLELAQRIIEEMTQGGMHYRVAYKSEPGVWRLDDFFTADQLEAIATVMRADSA